MESRVSDETIRWTVRLPRRVRDALKVVAEQEHRSLNGQLVAALEVYLAQREAAKGPTRRRQEV